MSAASEDVRVYLYAITPAAAVEDMSLLSAGVAEGPLRTVEVADLAAVVGDVAATGFDDDEQPRDPERVEREVRDHDEVLRGLLAATPLIPLRFGTLVEDDQAVARFVTQHRVQLDATLQRLRGTFEWGVKGSWATEDLRAHVAATSDDERVTAATPAQGGGGASYLLGKRRDLAVAREADRVRETVLQDCHDRLSEEARETALLPVRTGRGDMVLNASYLVEEPDRLGEALEELAAEYAPAGLRLERTGPWPPYSFVDGAVLEERPS